MCPHSTEITCHAASEPGDLRERFGRRVYPVTAGGAIPLYEDLAQASRPSSAGTGRSAWHGTTRTVKP